MLKPLSETGCQTCFTMQKTAAAGIEFVLNSINQLKPLPSSPSYNPPPLVVIPPKPSFFTFFVKRNEHIVRFAESDCAIQVDTVLVKPYIISVRG